MPTTQKYKLFLAKAFVELGQFKDGKELLDQVININPNYKSPDGHLLYARAASGMNDRKLAREEYEVLSAITWSTSQISASFDPVGWSLSRKSITPGKPQDREAYAKIGSPVESGMGLQPGKSE